jgi:hypothetical protein
VKGVKKSVVIRDWLTIKESFVVSGYLLSLQLLRHLAYAEENSEGFRNNFVEVFEVGEMFERV